MHCGRGVDCFLVSGAKPRWITEQLIATLARCRAAGRLTYTTWTPLVLLMSTSSWAEKTKTNLQPGKLLTAEMKVMVRITFTVSIVNFQIERLVNLISHAWGLWIVWGSSLPLVYKNKWPGAAISKLFIFISSQLCFSLFFFASSKDIHDRSY